MAVDSSTHLAGVQHQPLVLILPAPFDRLLDNHRRDPASAKVRLSVHRQEIWLYHRRPMRPRLERLKPHAATSRHPTISGLHNPGHTLMISHSERLPHGLTLMN